MDLEPRHKHPALATGVPVTIVVGMHLAISTAIIALVDPDVPALLPYWLVSVLAPAAVWAVLVIARAAVWRRPSAFWLGASAGIVVLLSFLAALILFLGDARLGSISARGVPHALVYSSWVLLGCAVLVAIVLRALGKHADAPIDADDRAASPVPMVEGDSPAEGDSAPAEQSSADSR